MIDISHQVFVPPNVIIGISHALIEGFLKNTFILDKCVSGLSHTFTNVIHISHYISVLSNMINVFCVL